MIPRRFSSICSSITLLLATTLPALSHPDNDAMIRAIRKQYQFIDNSTAHYTPKERDLPGESTEGSELVGYYQKGKLRKIVATYYGEGGKVIEEYYFAKGKPLFILRTGFRYKLPIYMKPDAVIASTKQERFYFQNDHLFRWLGTDNKAKSVTTTEAKTQERKYLQHISHLIQMLTDP